MVQEWLRLEHYGKGSLVKVKTSHSVKAAYDEDKPYRAGHSAVEREVRQRGQQIEDVGVLLYCVCSRIYVGVDRFNSMFLHVKPCLSITQNAMLLLISHTLANVPVKCLFCCASHERRDGPSAHYLFSQT